MAVEASIPILGIVLTAAIIDSINPCAIGVLILLISVMLSGRQNTGRMLVLGSIYIASVFTVYLLAGLGLLYTLAVIPLVVAEYLSIAVGTLIIAAGLVEIKDFFWYGRWFSLTIPYALSRRLEGYTKKATVPGVIFLGAFVAAVELPCTGAPYLAIITLLSQYFDATAFALLVLYNLVFTIPLFAILFLVAAGMKLHRIKRWKQENRPYMRLLAGLLLVGMGWLLMLIANGTVNLG